MQICRFCRPGAPGRLGRTPELPTWCRRPRAAQQGCCCRCPQSQALAGQARCPAGPCMSIASVRLGYGLSCCRRCTKHERGCSWPLCQEPLGTSSRRSLPARRSAEMPNCDLGLLHPKGFRHARQMATLRWLLGHRSCWALNIRSARSTAGRAGSCASFATCTATRPLRAQRPPLQHPTSPSVTAALFVLCLIQHLHEPIHRPSTQAKAFGRTDPARLGETRSCGSSWPR